MKKRKINKIDVLTKQVKEQDAQLTALKALLHINDDFAAYQSLEAQTILKELTRTRNR